MTLSAIAVRVEGIGGYSEPGIGDRNCGVTSTAGGRVRRRKVGIVGMVGRGEVDIVGIVRRGKGNGSCAGLAPSMPPLLVG